jgi:hypothetical protein
MKINAKNRIVRHVGKVFTTPSNVTAGVKSTFLQSVIVRTCIHRVNRSERGQDADSHDYNLGRLSQSLQNNTAR